MSERIEITLDELFEIQLRIDQRVLKSTDWPILGGLLSNFILRQKARIDRLTKAAAAAAAREQAAQESTGSDHPEDAIDAEFEVINPEVKATDSAASSSENNTEQPAAGNPKENPDGNRKTKGHGRNGKSDYTNAKDFFYDLAAGIVGSICEACRGGRMKKYRDKVIIRVLGQPLFAVEQHHAAQARCEICGRIITALLPPGLQDGFGKAVIYHPGACAMLMVMHYYASMPFKRLEALHNSWGIPLADANQYDVVDAGVERLTPLLKALETHAVLNALHFLIDDTGTMVIDIKKQIDVELKAAKALGLSKGSVRTGINATCVYVETPQGKVIMFFTGRHHAGEIVDQLLKRRPADLEKIVKVSDGASKNFDHRHGAKLIEGVCNAHAFLKFYAIKEKFPVEYALVGQAYDKVFENDAYTLKAPMSATDRLAYHQKHSRPWMTKILRLCEDKTVDKRLEPASPLWEPISFFIRNWVELTKFLEIAGVPIHTNTVEQNLIIITRYLAASFNYKTQNGADTGDCAMGLIVTARANDVEPVAYITHCLENHKDLKKNPAQYLPWVYRDRTKKCAKPPADQCASIH